LLAEQRIAVQPSAKAPPVARVSRGDCAGAPWLWEVRARTLWVIPVFECRVLSWAPLNGGFRVARVLANHQIDLDDRVATAAPRSHLARILREEGYDPGAAVAMMTGADVARVEYTVAEIDGVTVGAWCTAGLSNALRVGDPGTFSSAHAGTINLIVMVDRAMTDAAMVEAVQLAAEARTLAVVEAGLKSVRTGSPATGTGTDCIVVAAAIRASTRRADVERYCGKHTQLGEWIGRTVLESCKRAIHVQR
jgi:adenosylcobinamide amidohydrolase